MYKHRDGFTLKKLSPKHLDQLLVLKNESWWGTHGTHFLNEVDQEKWLNSLGNNTMAFAGMDREQKISGVAIFDNIDWIGRCCSVSGSLLKKNRTGVTGRDLFSSIVDFAFEILNMHRINAEVLVNNLAAYHIEVSYLKFKIEGRKKQAIYKSGHYYDSLLLGILREDWEKHERVVKLRKMHGTCNLNFDKEKADSCVEKVNSDVLKRDIQF